MSEEQIQRELTNLGKRIRNTRIGMVVGWGVIGIGTYYGMRHLGEKHHQVFSDLYRQNKTQMDVRTPLEKIKDKMPELYFPPSKRVTRVTKKEKPAKSDEKTVVKSEETMEGCPLGSLEDLSSTEKKD